eukprot:7136664-Pyramimonas_sp.AAC.1
MPPYRSNRFDVSGGPMRRAQGGQALRIDRFSNMTLGWLPTLPVSAGAAATSAPCAAVVGSRGRTGGPAGGTRVTPPRQCPAGYIAKRRPRGSTRAYDIRKELTGELNSPVKRWLNKVLTVNSTVSVSSPSSDASEHE